MKTPEATGYGMEGQTEEPRPVDYWLADAAQVNRATGTAYEQTARGMYVVNLLAMVEADQARTGESYTEGAQANLLNVWYNGGIWLAAKLTGTAKAPPVEYSHRQWSDYLHTFVFPRIDHESQTARSSFYALSLELHDPEGGARFSDTAEHQAAA